MSIVSVTRAGWTQIVTTAIRVQVFGGRIQVADSATPAEGDWHVWPVGAVVDAATAKWARAIDTTPTHVVLQAA